MRSEISSIVRCRFAMGFLRSVSPAARSGATTVQQARASPQADWGKPGIRLRILPCEVDGALGGSVEVLGAVSGLIFLSVCGVIGVRLLLIPRTTRQTPELAFGAGLTLMVLVGCPFAILGAIPGLLWAMRGSADGAVLRWTVLYACIPAMLVGMSRHRIGIEPVLIVAAAGFFSRLGRPRDVKLLPGALVVLGWGLLAFLWLLAAREVTAVAALVWSG